MQEIITHPPGRVLMGWGGMAKHSPVGEGERVGKAETDKQVWLEEGAAWAVCHCCPIKGLEPFHVHHQQKAWASVYLPRNSPLIAHPARWSEHHRLFSVRSLCLSTPTHSLRPPWLSVSVSPIPDPPFLCPVSLSRNQLHDRRDLITPQLPQTCPRPLMIGPQPEPSNYL